MTAINVTDDDEIDDMSWVSDALAQLRRRLWMVILGAAALLLVAVIYLRGAVYTYDVALRIVPAQSAAAARENSNISALSSLASLTGIAVPVIPATPFRLYQEGIFTREVADRLARDPLILRGCFPDEWNAAAKAWHRPDGLPDRLHSGLYGLVGAPDRGWSPPDGARLQRLIATRVKIDQNVKTPLVTIAIAARDPAFGRYFLQHLHRTVDDYLRETALQRNLQNITYLNDRLQTVAIAEHRQALFATLSDQQQRLMLVRNPAAYAAEPFGAITQSPLPTSPRPIIISAAAILLGAGLGVVVALLVPPRRRMAGTP